MTICIVAYPNPEEPAAFKLSMDYRKNMLQMFIFDRPNADRVGVVVKNGGDYTLLSGN